MKTFLFIFLTGYAVSGDDNYYVIRMPETLPSNHKEFKVYWNVPTMQCKSKKILFDNLLEKYGIIQNTDDVYRGDKIGILYDPGNFPALIKNASTGEIKYRNGGVPQEGDLVDHLQNFKKDIQRSICDQDFNGIGIIDFESWRPILRQNFGSLTPYKDVSYDIEKKRHRWWKKQWIEEEARRRFDAAGRDFMKTTISLAKKMRPKALWGYYGYPQCFNKPYSSRPEECADVLPAENDKIPWLWQESTALFPSVYSPNDVTGKRLAAFIRGRIKESERVRVTGTPIFPYWWFRYRDGGYFREEDLETSFSTFYNSNVSGFIIWGSSKDVNTEAKCMNLKKYVANILGPAIVKYTKATRRINDVPDDSTQTIFKPEVVTEFDPEYHWEPPENYTSNIEHIVEEELKTKKKNESRADGNVLIDIILNKIANFCLTNCNDKTDVTPESKTVLTTKNPFLEGTDDITTTAQTTTNDETFKDDSDTTTVTNLHLTTSMESESTELNTAHLYENYLNTSDVNTTPSSIEVNTEDARDTKSTQKSTDTILNSENSSITNFINYSNSLDETDVNDRPSTVSSITTTAIMPNLNINNTSSDNFSSTVTSAPDLSSLSTSTIFSLDAFSTTNLSDTSPSNVHEATTPASRPDPINWRRFYTELLNLSYFVKNELRTNDTNAIETTAAPELADQVVVSVV